MSLLVKSLQLTKLFRNYPLTIYFAIKKKNRRNTEQIHVCDQMALCNPLPDFNSEEVTSVARSKTDIFGAVEDMAEHLPKEDPGKGDIVIHKTSIEIELQTIRRFSQSRPG